MDALVVRVAEEKLDRGYRLIQETLSHMEYMVAAAPCRYSQTARDRARSRTKPQGNLEEVSDPALGTAGRRHVPLHPAKNCRVCRGNPRSLGGVILAIAVH
jgi:hypothetical protein